ncbi:MAG TPA: cytochrome c oxidase assembly protein [Gammaproteobacteria bacterium]|nr:cytochrome c oxidase assembly protein [Gammaproteobacteria bacterium]
MIRSRKLKHTALLVLLAVGMFGFAFALVPLYTVFCELTGLNGRTAGQESYAGPVVAASDRQITIQFLAHVGNGMPWEFRPTEHRLQVRPGEMHTTMFYARNRATRTVAGQAVPSVTPGQAALHLHKIECFCFTQQELDAGEEMEMPVAFYVDEDLPKEIRTFSLSYTLFPVDSTPGTKVADN